MNTFLLIFSPDDQGPGGKVIIRQTEHNLRTTTHFEMGGIPLERLEGWHSALGQVIREVKHATRNA